MLFLTNLEAYEEGVQCACLQLTNIYVRKLETTSHVVRDKISHT